MYEDIINQTTIRNLFRMVKKYVLSHCGTTEDVEDALQDGLYKFMKHSEKNGFEKKDSVENYIFSICKNSWLKEVEKRNKLNQSSSFIVEEIEDCGRALREKHRHDALQAILDNNFKLLSKKCQKALNLKKEGLTCDEIAELLGLKNGRIAKDKYYRCKERLRDLVKQDKAYRNLINDE